MLIWEENDSGSVDSLDEALEQADKVHVLQGKESQQVDAPESYATVLASVELIKIRHMPLMFLLTWVLPKFSAQGPSDITTKSKGPGGSRVSFLADRNVTENAASILQERVGSSATSVPAGHNQSESSLCPIPPPDVLCHSSNKEHDSVDQLQDAQSLTHSNDDHSSYSKASAITSQHRLLRRIIEGLVRDTKPPLAAVRMKSVLLATVVFFVVITSVLFATVSGSSQHLVRTYAELTWLSMERMKFLLLFVSTAAHVRSARLGVPAVSHSQSLHSMRYYWEEYKHIHVVLLSKGEEVGGDQLMWDKQPGHFSMLDMSTNRTLVRSLFELSAQVESSLEEVATRATPATMDPSELPAFGLLLGNLFETIVPALNSSSLVKSNGLGVYINEAAAVEMYMTAAVLVVCALMNILVATSALKSLEREKKAIARMLLFIPRWGCQILHERAQRMYQSALQNAQSDALGLESESEDDDTNAAMTEEELVNRWSAKERGAAKRALTTRQRRLAETIHVDVGNDGSELSYSTDIRLTTMPPRAFRSTSNFITRSVMKLIMPLPVMLLWAAIIWVTYLQQQVTVGNYARRVHMVSQISAVTLAMQLHVGAVGLHDWASRTAYAQRVADMESYLLSQTRVMLHGSDDYVGRPVSPLPQDIAAYGVFTKDACIGLSSGAACREWLEGVNNHGLVGWLSRYTATSRRIASLMAASQALNATMELEGSTEFRDLQERLWLMIRYILDASLEDTAVSRIEGIFRDEIRGAIDTGLFQQRTAIIVFNVGMVLLFLVFWRPTANNLGSSLSATRTLMVVTPQIALTRVPAVESLVKQLGASREPI